VASIVFKQDLKEYSKTSSFSPVAFSGNYTDLNNLPTIPTIPSNISAFNNDRGYVTTQYLSNAIANKANSATTLDGYGITDAYTKDDVDDLLEENKVTVPTNISAFTNDKGYLIASDLSTYMKLPSRYTTNTGNSAINSLRSGQLFWGAPIGASLDNI
jgi:hypothetical protein